MVKKEVLQPEEQDRIRVAIQKAEVTTSGEIVVCISRQSDKYSAVNLFVSFVISLMIHFVIAIAYTELGIFFYFEAQIIAFIAAYMILERTGAVIWFLTRSQKQTGVKREAMHQFFACCLDNTKERNGVLIYISLRERAVEILADHGLNEKINSDSWAKIADDLAQNIRSDSLGAAIVIAVEACGEHLAIHMPKEDDDINELPNFIKFTRQ